MIRGEPLTAIIPARAGSKGIPNKNLLKINGETLVERALIKAKNCDQINRVFVSTDDPRIFEIAKKMNAAPSAMRPAYLAGDHSKTIDAVFHLMENENIGTGYILLLQVTTPLWKPEDLFGLIKTFEKKIDFDAIVSVVKHDAPHPNKMLTIENGKLRSYLGSETGVARQSLPDVYALNGAFYLISVAALKQEKTFIPDCTIPYIMPPERSVNLDGPLDLILLEALAGAKITE
jgi:CMP-N,N'-diacetyllegionaminic acid synthase